MKSENVSIAAKNPKLTQLKRMELIKKLHQANSSSICRVKQYPTFISCQQTKVFSQSIRCSALEALRMRHTTKTVTRVKIK
ncbi:hypothetical protein T07_2967 [Trichinella nelsoni]|uniref:Uncharacterized protein n=1 Tax=Trichinella nelsoni TaxID=6336 RepID=A0A0V0RD52_9BILA|nr:hypothetical protein T07_2967 [Trichinella nelsoni]